MCTYCTVVATVLLIANYTTQSPTLARVGRAKALAKLIKLNYIP